ncbi:hypothetical protein [Pseudofrankia sp. EUN1h]|uniref:hypothetical protein n=1 Tax=Pseudofrankia sp. EUN1h TaxID=1834515 RepID=UPI0012FEE365|nr:hypothetical protein [Pseudofrankia sp. EUN1h]
MASLVLYRYAAGRSVNEREALTFPLTSGGFALLYGLPGFLNCLRMRWVLARNPWVSRRGRLREVTVNRRIPAPVLILDPGAKAQSRAIPTGDGPAHGLAERGPNGRPTILRLSVSMWRWGRHPSEFEEFTTVWFAGDPRAGGVVAPPGARDLYWARRLRIRRWANYLLSTTPE